ncbi:SpoIIE family protein phosphatase [uncultured Anaerovibrio sp.]|uniref:SpoIIE family protein phosphatase n=1 Tax=uncultured Anaerovibrio sp. TaxID=361586 RepID=UPI002626BEFD|nr:SpoIIE family protein phosphatase [uncultured Anaerovibrio sp.]
MKQIDIQKRILVIFLMVGLLTVVTIGMVSFNGLYDMQKSANESSSRMGDTVAAFAGELATEKTRTQIQENAKEKARQVEREMNMIRVDTEYLANAMTRILTHPERYSMKQLPNPLERRMEAGEAYLLIASVLKEECDNPAVQQEIGLAANVADDMEVMATFYKKYQTSCYFGSKYGYYITLECYDSDEMYTKIHSDNYHNNYDPRKRPWYKKAAAEGRAIFTDVYIGNDSYPEITCAVPYYDNNGLAGVAGLDVHLISLYRLASDRSLGTSNINFAINSKGEIIFSSEQEGILAPGDGKRVLGQVEEESLAREADNMLKGYSNVVPVHLNGEEYYLAYAPMPTMGWSFGTMLKRDEVLAPANEARANVIAHANEFKKFIRLEFFKDLLKFIVILMIIIWSLVYCSRRLAQQLVKPITVLNDGVMEIAKGNLDRRLTINTGDELEELAKSVNNMTDDLKSYMNDVTQATAEKERIATELSLAQSIQEGMLPNIFPKFSGNPHYELYATMDAAKEVGGDFYDFYNIDEQHVALTIADVSGKGVPASLFMVISKTLIKNYALTTGMEMEKEDNMWGQSIELANEQLCANNEEMMFVTVFFGVINIQTGEFTYVNAGHNPPLIGRRQDGTIHWEYLKKTKKNNIMGVSELAIYKEEYLKLNPGDMMFFYTDGVTEAMDNDNNLYGEERLLAAMQAVGTADRPVKDILAAVREDVDRHVAGADQSDDITMLGIRFLG